MGKLNDIRFVLASRSEARQEILKSLGLRFDVVVSDIDESEFKKRSDAYKMVIKLAEKKAYAVEMDHRDVIMSFDTVVVLNGKITGKPETRDWDSTGEGVSSRG